MGKKREKKIGPVLLALLALLVLFFLIFLSSSFASESVDKKGSIDEDTYQELRRSIFMLRDGDYNGLLYRLDSNNVPELFADFMFYLKGFAGYEINDMKLAEKYREELVSSYPGSIFTHYLNVDSAYYLVKQRKFEEAKDRIQGMKREPLFYLEGSRYFYVLGRIHLSNGEERKGIDNLLECLKRFPGTSPAVMAKKILVPMLEKKGMEGGETAYAGLLIELGQALAGEGEYNVAVKVLSPWRKHVRGKKGAELDLELANALRRAGRYTDAIRILLEEGRGESAARKSEKHFFAGIYSWYRGRTGEAENILKKVIEDFPGTGSSFRAAYNLGRMFEEDERFQDAYTYFGKASSAKERSLREEASFRMGLVQFLASDFGGAEEIFTGNVKRIHDEEMYYRNLFMKGYCLEKKGDKKGARAVYEEIISSKEGGLHYFLALRKLGKFQGWSVYETLAFKDVTSDSVLFGFMNEGKDGDKKDDLHIERALVFQKLGLYAFSSEEFKEIEKSDLLPRSVNSNVKKALFAYASGNLKEGIQLTFRGDFDFHFKKVDYLESGSYIRYPALGFMFNNGGMGNPDPFFLHAIFRQESLFEFTAISRAGAIGLGQIMPQTGRRLARQLEMDKYRRELLFDPMTNAMFSKAYVKSLMRLFDGDLLSVAAAYNAGEGAAMRWRKKSGGDPYLFPELIGYEETRKYVRKVFLNYLHYLKIYGVGFGDLTGKQ